MLSELRVNRRRYSELMAELRRRCCSRWMMEAVEELSGWKFWVVVHRFFFGRQRRGGRASVGYPYSANCEVQVASIRLRRAYTDNVVRKLI